MDTKGSSRAGVAKPPAKRAGFEVPRRFDLFDWLHLPVGMPSPTFNLLSEVAHPMRAEEFTEGSDHVVRIEMPGIDPEKDVELWVEDHVLFARVARRETAREEREGHFRSEFRYGEFARRIALPSGVSDDDVKATYRDGILELRFPAVSAVDEPARRIPVQHV